MNKNVFFNQYINDMIVYMLDLESMRDATFFSFFNIYEIIKQHTYTKITFINNIIILLYLYTFIIFKY